MTSPLYCPFCASDSLTLQYSGCFHPIVTSFGPFDFYVCNTCGSGAILPPPSEQALAQLYSSFQNGVDRQHRDFFKHDPQTCWYRDCVRRLQQHLGDLSGKPLHWLDAGAGAGELAHEMTALHPQSRGTAVDRHARPKDLPPGVEWRQCDFNAENFHEQINATFDVIISTAVWEHVLHPDLFVRNLLRCLKKPGILYLICPNQGSWARRILQKRWPYFIPGEHLSLPTPKGAQICVERQWRELGTPDTLSVQSRGILIPYTLRFLLERFNRHALARLFPPGIAMPMPAGALETVVKRT